jgi:hypothetical protein
MFFFSPLRTNSVFFLVLCIFSYTLSKSIRISKREIVDDSVVSPQDPYLRGELSDRESRD